MWTVETTAPLTPEEIDFYNFEIEEGLAASNGNTAATEAAMKQALNTWRVLQNSIGWGNRSVRIWHERLVTLARHVGVGHVPASKGGDFTAAELVFYEAEVDAAFDNSNASEANVQAAVNSIKQLMEVARNEAVPVGYGGRDIRGSHEYYVDLARDMGIAAQVAETIPEEAVSMLWKTDNPGLSANDQITLPLVQSGEYDFRVNWGDGSEIESITSWDDPAKTHTYPIPGEYIVVLVGTVRGWQFADTGDKDKLLRVTQWGELEIVTTAAFEGCSNLDVPAIDAPIIGTSDLSSMFASCAQLTQGARNFDVRAVTNFSGMFKGCAKYNEPLGEWSTGAAIDFSFMFENCLVFNQDISSWQTGSVTTIESMFDGCVNFDQSLDGWNTSQVTNMRRALAGTTDFDQDLATWNVGALTDATDFMLGDGISDENYDDLLISWEAQSLQPNVPINFGTSQYCSDVAGDARQRLLDPPNSWLLTDSGQNPQCELPTGFEMRWKTDNAGVSADNEITLPLEALGDYSLDVEWGDGTEDHITEYNDPAVTHTYDTPGEYDVKIRGVCRGWRFNNGGDRQKLLSISNWGHLELISDGCFYGCSNLVVTALDSPDAIPVDCTNMFRGCASLTGGLASWDMTGVESVQSFFELCSSYNENLSAWAVASQSFLDMSGMFRAARAFLGSGLEMWNPSSVTTLEGFFEQATLANPDISIWNIGQCLTLREAFKEAEAFNSALLWDTSRVTTLEGTFDQATAFNQLLSWNTSAVTNMSRTFQQATMFNQSLVWDVRAVTTLDSCFAGANSFTGDITSWQPIVCTNMDNMLFGTPFNRDISGWPMGSVQTARGMLSFCPNFNQPIGAWDTSSLANADTILFGTPAFDQSLAGWDVSTLTSAANMLDGISDENYDLTLISWGAQLVQADVPFGAGSSQYCVAEAVEARNALAAQGWTITDAGRNPVCGTVPFVSQWKTDNPGESENNQITLPLLASGTYDFWVDWGDATPRENITSHTEATHTYASPGTYTVTIEDGTIRGWRFNNGGDAPKILNISDWGELELTDSAAFYGCSNLTISGGSPKAIPANCSDMFRGCSSLTGGIAAWDTSGVTSMSRMLRDCSVFNESLPWNTSSVASMNELFRGCSAMNGSLPWTTTACTTMSEMFRLCDNFNQQVAFDTSNVTTMSGMFRRATLFNQPLVFDTSKVGDLSFMFMDAPAFDQILSWSVQNVTTIESCFENATSFTGGGLEAWTTSALDTVTRAFYNAGNFNADISGWSMGFVTSLESMFQLASSFNRDISGWTTAQVTSFANFLAGASSFNQDMSGLRTDAATTFELMYAGTAVDFDAGGYGITNLTNAANMFAGVGLSDANYDALLIGWAGQAFNPDVAFGAGNSQYCTAPAVIARQDLTLAGWTIADLGRNPECEAASVVTQWKTDNPGASPNDTIELPLEAGGAFAFLVDWGDDSPLEYITAAAASHTYAAPGTYTVQMEGQVRGFRFNNAGDAAKLLDVSEWGDLELISNGCFYGCVNFNCSATDQPSVLPADFTNMFRDCSSLTGGITNWTPTPTDMTSCFQGATSWNGDLSGWNVSNCLTMAACFEGCTSLTAGGVASWNVQSCANFSRMFFGCSSFVGDIGLWNNNMAAAQNLSEMLAECTSFNSILSPWDISKASLFTDFLRGATLFNQPLQAWNPAGATDMSGMLQDTAFNQPLAAWGAATAGVTTMARMFSGTPFNQPIGAWSVGALADASNMFSSPLSDDNYDDLLEGWEAQAVQNGVTLDAPGSQYCSDQATDARDRLVSNNFWAITDAGRNPSCIGAPSDFPVIESWVTALDGSNTTDHPTPYPEGVQAGDLLIGFGSIDGLNGPFTWDDGWVKVADQPNPTRNNLQATLAYKKADGSETGDFLITSAGAERMARGVLRISGAADPDVIPPEFTDLVGRSTTPSLALHTPSTGPQDYLWLAIICYRLTQTVLEYPADYPLANFYEIQSSSGSVAHAARHLNAASEQPGIFTMSANTDYVAYTMGIHPA